MKKQPSLKSNRVSRREFIAGTTAGLAAVGLHMGCGADTTQTASAAGASPAAAAPAEAAAAQAPAQFPGTGRYLYVTNNRDKRVDVVKTADHSLVWSFPWVGAEAVIGGATSHPATNRLYITHVGEDMVSAYDLATGKLAWQVNTLEKYGLRRPDRITLTTDGRALYVPMNWSRQTDAYGGWANHVNLVLDPSNGAYITEIARPGRPHNNWAGEGGQYMYLGGRSDQTMVLADQKTHKIAKTIGPFSTPCRQFITSAEEKILYVTLTRTAGFGVADIRTGKVLPEVPIETPKERTKYWSASSSGGGAGSLPHGDNPWGHGMGMRPGGSEDLYVMNDEWGYLHVFDTKSNPTRPKFKGNVELFSKIDEPWMAHSGFRWIAFSLDGKYCYPSSGDVVDCDTGKVTSMKIAPSEKLVDVEFQNGKPVRCTGQQGGVYGQVTT